jgi:DNA-binding NtrC family response regulator
VDDVVRANGSAAAAHGASLANGRNTTRSAQSRAGAHKTTALKQVVLVDREIDALRDVAIALRDEYDFHITISGVEALNLLRAGGIDTIVVGQTLYSSTGLNVLAEARRHAPDTHRVLLANAVEAGAIERGAAAVAPFKVLQRPCTPDKLRELLDAAAASVAAPEAARPATNVRPLPARAPTDTHDPADFEHVVLETMPEPPRRKSKQNRQEQDEAAALPVIVYTDDADFYRSIALALQDRHEIRLCTQLDRAAEFAEQGQCPLLITDRAATQVELQRISIALRALDAGMLTIAAGPPEVGSALRKLLGTSALHSFIPKPTLGAFVGGVREAAIPAAQRTATPRTGTQGNGDKKSVRHARRATGDICAGLPRRLRD